MFLQRHKQQCIIFLIIPEEINLKREKLKNNFPLVNLWLCIIQHPVNYSCCETFVTHFEEFADILSHQVFFNSKFMFDKQKERNMKGFSSRKAIFSNLFLEDV